jgi:hypothetical protein
VNAGRLQSWRGVACNSPPTGKGQHRSPSQIFRVPFRVFSRVSGAIFLLIPLASFAGWGTITMDPPNSLSRSLNRCRPCLQAPRPLTAHSLDPFACSGSRGNQQGASHESNRKEPPTRQYVDAPVYCVRAPPEVQTLAPACSGNHPCQAQGTFPDRPAWHGPSWR